MPIKRADSERNKAKVAKEVVKNPLQTQREVSEKTWLWLWTVNRKWNELEHHKDDRIIWITNRDISIVELAQKEIERRLMDKKETKKMRTTEISQVATASERRYQIFRGSVTDSKGWLRDLRHMTIEELEEYRKELLWE